MVNGLARNTVRTADAMTCGSSVLTSASLASGCGGPARERLLPDDDADSSPAP